MAKITTAAPFPFKQGVDNKICSIINESEAIEVEGAGGQILYYSSLRDNKSDETKSLQVCSTFNMSMHNKSIKLQYALVHENNEKISLWVGNIKK